MVLSVVGRYRAVRQFASLVTEMRAAVVRQFGPASNILIEQDVPVPSIDDHQVLVRVKAAGINPVDTYIRSGAYAKLPPLPYSPGREGAGVVERVGSAVNKVTVGQNVWFVNPSTGSCADFAAINAATVFPLPDECSFVQGSTLGIAYLTAYRALFIKARAQAGESCFIHGASGGVGLAAVQLAKSHGLRVFGTAGSEDGIALAIDAGAEWIVNHNEPNYLEQLLNRHPGGFDVILEMLANVNLNHDLALLATFGRIAVIGNRGPIEIDPRSLMQKEGAIEGVFLNHTNGEEFDRMAEAINVLLRQGAIKPVVDSELHLKDLSEGHRLIMEKSRSRGKLVINLELP